MKTKNSNFTSVLFIDSGIGGLTTLAETSKFINSNYIYFADNKFAPFGTKSETFLQQRLYKIISSLSKKYKISMVVLACNTATTTSVSFLRQQFLNLPIIGTEPAFKVAKDNNFSNPALVATPQTISHLTSKNVQGFNLISSPFLATQIEHNFVNHSIKNQFELIKTLYQLKFRISENDCLVLGCTHYVFVKDNLYRIFKKPIIDGNKGVAHQVASLYRKKTPAKSTFKIILSNKNTSTLQNYKKILKQILANQINLC